MTLMGKLMTGAGVLALSTGVAAAAPAVVANDLNLRAGPGVEYPVVTAMPGGATVDVMGCEGGWCQVAFNGTQGWASRAYMGLGGGVAAAPAYGESYAAGEYAPRYGYDADSYAYGSAGAGNTYTYGYSGDAAIRGTYGAAQGERTFGNERRVGEQSAVRGESRVGEATTMRSDRRSVQRGANARSTAQRAPEQPAAGAGNNSRAETRGSASQPRSAARAQGLNDNANARATTGAGSSDQDHGPNFIGPGKKNVDNH